MKNELLRMVEKRQMGIHCGIPSFCSANKIVIETKHNAMMILLLLRLLLTKLTNMAVIWE